MQLFRPAFLLVLLALLLPSSARAGEVQTRIVGGDTASIADWPGMTAFYPGNYICGGTKINARWVVTAGHCFSNDPFSNWSVSLGSAYRDNSYVRLDKAIRHPLYDNYDLANDIALLKLAEPISGPVMRITSTGAGPAGSSAEVAGWGTTCFDNPASCPVQDFLRQASVTIQDYNSCYLAYMDADTFLPANTLCASSPGRDACQGDSGGPLRQNGELIGIVSSGIDCASSDFPGIYTDVRPYRNWIGKYVATVSGPRSVRTRYRQNSKIQIRNTFYLPTSITRVSAPRGYKVVRNGCKSLQSTCSLTIRRTSRKAQGGTLVLSTAGGVVRKIKLY